MIKLKESHNRNGTDLCKQHTKVTKANSTKENDTREGDGRKRTSGHIQSDHRSADRVASDLNLSLAGCSAERYKDAECKPYSALATRTFFNGKSMTTTGYRHARLVVTLE
jgi:hypothetical protein